VLWHLEFDDSQGSPQLSAVPAKPRLLCEHSLIVTARLNDVDPQVWLANILAHIAERTAKA
jgi:hypothetical protein